MEGAAGGMGPAVLDPSAGMMMDPMGGMLMADPMAAMSMGAGQVGGR